jgi:hypothetical protein
MVLNLLFELIDFFGRFWDRLDDKTKRQIVEAVIDSFKKLLRAYYRSWKTKKEGNR